MFKWSQNFWKSLVFSFEFQKFFSITRTSFSHSRSAQFCNKIPYCFRKLLWKQRRVLLTRQSQERAWSWLLKLFQMLIFSKYSGLRSLTFINHCWQSLTEYMQRNISTVHCFSTQIYWQMKQCIVIITPQRFHLEQSIDATIWP